MNKIISILFALLLFCSIAYSDQSYENEGGMGDRTSIITVTSTTEVWYVGYATTTSLVNGVFNDQNLVFNNASAVGKWIKFAFATARIITEAKWFQDTNNPEATWKWQGSSNDSDWVDIGSPFTLGGSTEQTQTELSSNATAYRYYRLLCTAGLTDWNPFVREIEFQIDSGVTTSIKSVLTITYANIKKLCGVTSGDIKTVILVNF